MSAPSLRLTFKHNKQLSSRFVEYVQIWVDIGSFPVPAGADTDVIKKNDTTLKAKNEDTKTISNLGRFE